MLDCYTTSFKLKLELGRIRITLFCSPVTLKIKIRNFLKLLYCSIVCIVRDWVRISKNFNDEKIATVVEKKSRRNDVVLFT